MRVINEIVKTIKFCGLRSAFDVWCISFKGGQFQPVNDRMQQSKNPIYCCFFAFAFSFLLQTFYLWELMSKCQSFAAIIIFTFIEIENHTI